MRLRRVKSRRKIAEVYKENLQELQQQGKIKGIPNDGPNWRHSFNLYVVQVEPKIRNAIVLKSREENIPLAIHYEYPCHQQPYLGLEVNNLNLNETLKYCKSIISLPMHPYMTKGQTDRVIKFLDKNL